MKRKCPKCGSEDVKVTDEEIGFIKCRKCGFDELKEDMNFDERNTQREKTRYSPYRQVGGRKK
jgi:Zn ribbon nucleic-acid-binding protein